MDKLAFAERMRTAPTPPEALFWKSVQGGKMACSNYYLEPPIRVNRQQVILGYIADFYLPRYRAIIEVDGEQHDEEAQSIYDDRRDRVFLDKGYSVFRIRARLVMRDMALVKELVEAFADELADPDVRMPRYWTFDFWGLLTEARDPDFPTSCRHHFRVTASLPPDVICEYGAEYGETDAHEVKECRASRCREWAA